MRCIRERQHKLTKYQEHKEYMWDVHGIELPENEEEG
jgi:hypothetical protein